MSDVHSDWGFIKARLDDVDLVAAEQIVFWETDGTVFADGRGN